MFRKVINYAGVDKLVKCSDKFYSIFGNLNAYTRLVNSDTNCKMGHIVLGTSIQEMT